MPPFFPVLHNLCAFYGVQLKNYLFFGQVLIASVNNTEVVTAGEMIQILST